MYTATLYNPLPFKLLTYTEMCYFLPAHWAERRTVEVFECFGIEGWGTDGPVDWSIDTS